MKLRIGINLWPGDPNKEADKFIDVEFDLPSHIWIETSGDRHTSIEERLNELFVAMLLGRRLLR